MIDWYGPPEIDAEREDSIREHPEIWAYYELPECLRNLRDEDYVSVCLVPDLNLNAIAIGLGLEDVKYEPEVFAGLLYHPSDIDSQVLCSSSSIDADESMVISISEDAGQSKEAIMKTIHKIDDLGLMNTSDRWEDSIETEQVAELTSSEK